MEAERNKLRSEGAAGVRTVAKLSAQLAAAPKARPADRPACAAWRLLQALAGSRAGLPIAFKFGVAGMVHEFFSPASFQAAYGVRRHRVLFLLQRWSALAGEVQALCMGDGRLAPATTPWR